MRKRTHLVVIDPQNDFCDLPADYLPLIAGNLLTPSLPIAGSHADMQRIAAIIRRGGAGLTDITVTMDAHHRIDIAHPPFWVMGDGSKVSPFTQILAKDVRDGKYIPRISQSIERVIQYLDTLEARGSYVHMVWPVHCEMGTWGQNVHEDVRRAYSEWEVSYALSVNKILKGTNPWTEHYSAIKAEVYDPDDISTQINLEFLERLHCSDRIYVAGEAGSHCVKATVEHIVQSFSHYEMKKLVLLTDCMSPVAGFETPYSEFINEMEKRGVQIANSDTVISELIANG
jgi:nicotinamidase-related amidase